MNTTHPPLSLRRAGERGHADHGWLDSWHTFSFGDYYDPAHMGFHSLRVINDDRLAPGEGFPLHPHRDMEIFSWVLSGALAHEDSLGNRRVLRPGELQLMSAGSGIRHSEFNPSPDEEARFLQIWITPRTRGLAPSYSEWKPASAASASKTLVISPDGREGSAAISQDALVHLLKLTPGRAVHHRLAPGRGLWLHLASGEAAVRDIPLRAGDAVSLEGPADLAISGSGEAILFDLG